MFGKWKKILKKPDTEKEESLREQIDREGGLDKTDVPAMLLSAFLVFLPVALVVLAVFVGLAFLLIH